ncbi:hypothetical protein chiPu_0021603 [Chiloscyllium punctatum]|uniref:valine--tRNA ligase n=1 Tax=Chiloscyllium punctatum TaxID=137246 RepID=A0A401RII2_CHIPU|nr:hypothetical protein [Chiloscyllium punctatum]
MSKSLGNVIDPLDVIFGITLEGLHAQLLDSNLDPVEIERAKAGQKSDYPVGIPECGTDALRFALCAYTSQGRDINLDVNRILGYRHFCNKLWNATKFAIRGLGENFKPEGRAQYCWRNEELDRTVEFVMTIIRAIRSLRADYNLTKTKAGCYLSCSDEGTAAQLNPFSSYIQTLSSSKSVTFLVNEECPDGCAMVIASDRCTVHLMLKGLIDAEKEVTKLRAKQADVQKQIAKLREKISKADYSTKVPQKIQELDAEKLKQMETELQKVEEGIRNFEKMI